MSEQRDEQQKFNLATPEALERMNAIGKRVFDAARPTKENDQDAIMESVMGLAMGYACACETQGVPLEVAITTLRTVFEDEDVQNDLTILERMSAEIARLREALRKIAESSPSESSRIIASEALRS